MSVNEVIVHCQKQIKKEPSDEKLLHYLRRLSRLRITVQNLVETGVGRTVNNLSRQEGKVGENARKIVQAWKEIVEVERQSDEDEEDEEEEEEEDQQKLNTNHIITKIENKIEISTYQDTSNIHNSYDNNNDYAVDDDDEFVIDTDAEPEINHESGAEETTNNAESNVEDNKEFEEKRKENFSEVIVKKEKEELAVENHRRSRQKKKKKKRSHSNSRKSSSHRKSPSKSSRKRKEYNTSDEEERKSKKVKYEKEKSPISTVNNNKNTKLKDESTNKSFGFDFPVKIKEEKFSPKDSDEEVEDEIINHQKCEDYDIGLDRRNDYLSTEATSSAATITKSKEKEKSSTKIKTSSSCNESEIKRHNNTDSNEKNKNKYDERPEHSSKSKRTEEKLEKSSAKSSKDSNHHHHKNSKEKSKSSQSKSAKVVALNKEVDSTSGFNFADVLGSIDRVSSKTKVSSGSNKSKTNKKTVISNGSHSNLNTNFFESNKSDSKSSSSSSKWDNKKESHHHANNSLANGKEKKYNSGKYSMDLESSFPMIEPFSSISPSTSTSSSKTFINIPKPLDEKPVINSSELLNLKPYQINNSWENLGYNSSQSTTAKDTLSTMMSSRKERTKVYSGTKSYSGEIPKLFEMCLQVVQENIDWLGYTGGIPFFILKPVLERATSKQLEKIEEYNHYLIESTDELWKFHCKREFHNKAPGEMEAWRELYFRCRDEREQKFAVIKSKMKLKEEVAVPVRKAKLAYVDTSHGPKFSKSKAATIKNGMKSLKVREEKKVSSSSKKDDMKKPLNNQAGSSKGSSQNSQNQNQEYKIEEASVIIPASATDSFSRVKDNQPVGPLFPKKPKRAPLMQKTLKLIKSVYRR